MKRAILTKYGGPENFEIQEYKPRELLKGQALIENYSSSVNPVDIYVRQGKMRLLTGFGFPKQFGSDFAGKVIASKNPKLKKGDEIFGFANAMKGKTYNEQVIVDKKSFAKKPKHLSLHEAGVLGVAGFTAYVGLVEYGGIKARQKVFINGCTGGVGSMGVMIAKALGATVTGTCSSDNLKFAKEIGVDYPMDYENVNFENLEKSFDFIFDAASKLSASQIKKLSKKGARSAVTRPSRGILANSIFSSSVKILNISNDTDKLPDYATFLERNKIKPAIGKEYPLTKVAEAHRDFEENSTQGKMMIKIK